MNHFEQFDRELDAVFLDASGLLKGTPWVTRLQDLRDKFDAAHNEGALSDNEWKALVSRSARIQDTLNEEH